MFKRWQDKDDRIFPEASNGDQDNDIKGHCNQSHNEDSVHMRAMAESSQSIMDPVAIAASVIDLYQLSRGMLPMFDQACDFTPDEMTRGFRNDLVALSNTLKDIKDLFIIGNPKEEIQGHSRCLSVGIYEELQKLTRESRMVLMKSNLIMTWKQNVIRRYPRLFASRRQDIGEITLRWKTVLPVLRTTHLSSVKDMTEFDDRNMTKHSRYAIGHNIERSKTSHRVGRHYEKTNEYGNNTIAIVGMASRFPDHTGNAADVWDMLADDHRPYNPGNSYSIQMGERWDGKQEFGDSRDGSRWCQGLDDRGGAQTLGIVTSIGITNANHGSGDQGNCCLTDPAYLTFSKHEGQSYIGSSQASPSTWYCCNCHFGPSETGIRYILSTGVQPNDPEPTDPKLTRWTCRPSRVRPASGLATAMPVALVSAACAFCMYSYAANRHGWHTLHSAEKLFFVAAINDPSPPWLVAATLLHGIATLFYYYLRLSDRFREVFVGAGIVTASACGIWSGVDVEGLLLGVLPVVITASLFLCTITNVAAEGFKSVSHLQQSRELDLENGAGR